MYRHAGRALLRIPTGYPGKLAEEFSSTSWCQICMHRPTRKDFPLHSSPLTRQHRSIAGMAEKWDLHIRSAESATAYCELVDLAVQRERFEAQVTLTAAGDDEAMPWRRTSAAAMEYGMPPSGGMGMGIDRLLMALMGSGIHETIGVSPGRPQWVDTTVG